MREADPDFNPDMEEELIAPETDLDDMDDEIIEEEIEKKRAAIT